MTYVQMFEDTAPFSQYDAYEAARLVAKDGARPDFGSRQYPDEMIR